MTAPQCLLTRAAGNKNVHFYLMEIPEDLQVAENMSGKRNRAAVIQPPCTSTGDALAPHILHDLDGDGVHEIEGAEVQDDSMEVRLGQPQGVQGGLSGRAVLLPAQLYHRNTWPIAFSLHVLQGGRETWLHHVACGCPLGWAGRVVSPPKTPGLSCPIEQGVWGGSGCIRAPCSHLCPTSGLFPGLLSPQSLPNDSLWNWPH